MCHFALLQAFLLCFCLISASSITCDVDHQPFLIPDEDPDDISPQPDLNTCENSVMKAIKCRDAYLHNANITKGKPDASVISWSIAAMINPSVIKQLIASTSSKAFEFLGDLGDIFDKVEMFEYSNNNFSTPPEVSKTMSRKAMVAQQMGKVRSSDYRTPAVKKETLAKSAFFSLGHNLGAVSDFLGPIGASVGAVTSVVAGLVPQPLSNVNFAVLQDQSYSNNILKEMGDNFGKVYSRFDQIETRLDSLQLTIEKTVIYASYRENQDRIRDVRLKHRQFLTSPSRLTLQELRQICQYKDPQVALDWIHRQVVYNNIGVELIPTIVKDVEYDRIKLRQWIKIIITDAMEAMYLREVCVGARLAQDDSSAKADASQFNFFRISLKRWTPSNSTS